MSWSHPDGAPPPGHFGGRYLLRACVMVVVPGLGLFVGWRYEHSLGFNPVNDGARIDALLALVFAASATVVCGEVARASTDKRRWFAGPLMFSQVLNAQSQGAPMAVVLLAAGLWAALLLACATRRQRLALGSIWLCGGLLTITLLLALVTDA